MLAAALLSHWVFDLFVHVHDLPLTWSGLEKVGFGLWRRPLLALALEMGLVVIAYATLRGQLPAQARRAGDVSAVVLLVVQLFYVLGPPPASVLQMALAAEAIYMVMAVLAFRVDRASRAVSNRA